jgi:tetratricopeptide (TPR) repeat protein
MACYDWHVNDAHAEDLLSRGETLQEEGRLAEALALFDQVLTMDVTAAIRCRAYVCRADLSDDQDDLPSAIADMDRAVALDPESEWLFYIRGVYHQARADWGACVADLNQAIARNPDAAEFYEVRGMARYNQGDLEGARSDLGAAMLAKPDISLDLIVYRAVAALLLSRPADALPDLSRVLAREPNHEKALAQRAKAFEQCGNLAAALADLDTLRPLIAPSPGLERHAERLRARLKALPKAPDGK